MWNCMVIPKTSSQPDLIEIVSNGTGKQIDHEIDITITLYAFTRHETEVITLIKLPIRFQVHGKLTLSKLYLVMTVCKTFNHFDYPRLREVCSRHSRSH